MNDDLFKSIPPGSRRAKDTENRCIQEIANELSRCCRVHEEKLGESQKDVRPSEIERQEAESFAKKNSLWLPIAEVFSLGIPGPCGNENDTYVSNGIIFKVNNLLNSKGSIIRLLNKVLFHNELFPDTSYSLHAFTGFDGGTVMPIIKQDLIANATPATSIEIDTYMAAIGFNKTSQEGHYCNGTYKVWDLLPRNVLKDNDGDIYVIDAEIEKVTATE